MSAILRRVYNDTKFVIERNYEMAGTRGSGVDEEDSKNADAKSNHSASSDCDGQVIHFRTSCWVQEINIQALVGLVPEKGYIKMKPSAGRYTLDDSVVCMVGNLDDDEDFDELRYNHWTLSNNEGMILCMVFVKLSM